MSSPTAEAVIAAASRRQRAIKAIDTRPHYAAVPIRFSPRRTLGQRPSYFSPGGSYGGFAPTARLPVEARPPSSHPSDTTITTPDNNFTINDEDLLTPHSLSPSPASKKLFEKEAKAAAKARAAFNVIKLRNKVAHMSSARTKHSKSSSSKNSSNRRNSNYPKRQKRMAKQDNEDEPAKTRHPVHNDEDEEEEVGKSPPDSDDEYIGGNHHGGDIPMINRHREVFFERAFGDPDHGNCIAVRPQAELDHIVFVLEHWAVGQTISSLVPNYEHYLAVKKFRETHKEGYKYCEKYTVEFIELPDGMRRPVLRRIENNRPNGGRIVVSREQVFDAINEWHSPKGHMGMERTHTACRNKYYNCTQLLVRIFVETCYVCMQKNPTVKALRGSRKPIRSNRYRERFQVDLIDFRKMRKRDPFGVLMRWIVTVKDHSTGFTHVSAIPRKTARFVAHRLQEVFGLIGYPSIFHTDNGKEFTAHAILRFLRRINPNIITVTGRPRKPSDQGSVERMNRLVKRVIASELAERRMSGENPNWTEVLGTVMASINSQSGRCAYSASSFSSIFGQEYDVDVSCSKDEARQCWTVAERLRVRI